MSKENDIKFGRVTKKILILLGAGLALGLSHRPDQYFKIIKSAAREWREIDARVLRKSIKKLYESKLVDITDNSDGTTSVIINDAGLKRTLRFNLDKLKLKNPGRWDGLWRIIIFDIPEKYKRARDAFAVKLLDLGFKAIQRSVFVYPHDCKEELDFITEVFELKPFVRTIIAKDIDIGSDLRHRFKI